MGRGSGVAPGPFPHASRRTRRAPLDAAGSPRLLPSGWFSCPGAGDLAAGRVTLNLALAGLCPMRYPQVRRCWRCVRGARPTNWAWWRNCPDQFFCCWWCPVMAADRVIRWTTAVAAIGVAAVASCEHAYDLVRAHGEAGWTAPLVPLTVGGLIYASSMVMLDCARRRVSVPALARWLLGLGITATLAANVTHGLGQRPGGCGGGRVAGGRAGRLVRAAHDDHPLFPGAGNRHGPGRGA